MKAVHIVLIIGALALVFGVLVSVDLLINDTLIQVTR